MKNLILFILLINISNIYSQNVICKFDTITSCEKHSDFYTYDLNLCLPVEVIDLKLNLYNQFLITNEKLYDSYGNVLKRRSRNSFGSLSKFRHTTNSAVLRIEEPIEGMGKTVTVEGTIKYFQPSLENKSIQIIKSKKNKYNYYTNYAKDVSSDVKMFILNKSELEMLKSKGSKKYNKIIKKLARKDHNEEAIDSVKTIIDNYVEKDLSYYDKRGPYLDFYLDDPKRSIKGFMLRLEENDEIINNGKYLIKHNLIRIFTSKVEGKDYYLEFLISNEKSMKNINFKLENLKLE